MRYLRRFLVTLLKEAVREALQDMAEEDRISTVTEIMAHYGTLGSFTNDRH